MDLLTVNNYLAPDVVVSENQFLRFQLYIKEMLKWNKKINLTSLKTEEDCWEKHIVDSLFAAPLLSGDEMLLDVGSGAGLPSIPLKIFYPSINIESIDSVNKKIHFQQHCTRLLGLENFTVINERIESFSLTRVGYYDAIISRAFASLRDYVDLVAPMLKPGGKLLAMKSSAADREIDAAAECLSRTGFAVEKYIEKTLNPSGAQRVLLQLTKN